MSAPNWATATKAGRNTGPFAGILVTAAPWAAPRALLDQLEVGGRMVMPVGGDEAQELKVYDRTDAGFDEQVIERCASCA